MTGNLTKAFSFCQKNSLREWSFKKAVTIRTYRDYHPIPVPLNLLSQPVLALCRDSEQTNELGEELLESKVGQRERTSRLRKMTDFQFINKHLFYVYYFLRWKH